MISRSKYYNLTLAILLLGFLFFSVSCKSSPQATDYDKLCKIYEDIVPQPIDLSTKEMKIVERVQAELPNFFNTNFVHIEKARADKRYPFIKQLAEEETKKKWDCEVMRSYYANEFH